MAPSIVAFLFASLPFLDRRMERRPWRRPIAVGTYVFVFLALFGLGLASYANDRNNPGYAAQLSAQEKDTREFMQKPFEPELAQASLTASNVELANPLAAKGGRLFVSQSCNACHGDGGTGSPAGPRLVSLRARYSPEQLAAILKAPSPKMTAGGLSPLDLPGPDVDALVSYLETL